MLNKSEKLKILHLHEHYKINLKNALENANKEIVKEYEIRLETMKHVLDNLNLIAWE